MPCRVLIRDRYIEKYISRRHEVLAMQVKIIDVMLRSLSRCFFLLLLDTIHTKYIDIASIKSNRPMRACYVNRYDDLWMFIDPVLCYAILFLSHFVYRNPQFASNFRIVYTLILFSITMYRKIRY